MDSLRVGFFFDAGRRDHECTLLGLEDAYRRAKSTVDCFRASAQDEMLPERLQPGPNDDFVGFDAISLDPELASRPALRDSLFLFDSAVDLTSFPWTGGELDRLGRLERVAALDVRAWAFFRTVFDREIPLLPAPLPVYRGLLSAQVPRVVLIHNDVALGRVAAAEIRSAIGSLDPAISIVEVANGFRNPVRQSEWLRGNLQSAGAHVHIGAPPDCISVGRLIDTMNMRVPCIVFDSAQTPRDSRVPVKWRRPAYLDDVNVVRTSTIKAFAQAARIVFGDRAWANNLTRNALREVAIFHEQVQMSLLPSSFHENYLSKAP